MKIATHVYDELVGSCPSVPPETGGILGGREDTITAYEFDTIGANCLENSYRPDVGHLNTRIRDWAASEVEFLGVFHSHPPGERGLSMPDKGYIWQIMTAMPTRISRLYFPLVFPTCDLVAYVATRYRRKVRIGEDVVTLSEIDITESNGRKRR